MLTIGPFRPVERAVQLLKPLADQYQPKSSLHYPVFVDEHGDYVAEVEDSERGNICEDCIGAACQHFKAYTQPNGIYAGKCIEIWQESSPEKDDFMLCDFCYQYIDVGVLHTFNQEADHWLTVDDEAFAKALNEPREAWLLSELLNGLDSMGAHLDFMEKLTNRIRDNF